MRSRLRFSRYDRFILQSILHGYSTLKDIHAYVSSRIRREDSFGEEVSRSQISQLLKLLVKKKVLDVEEIEKDKKTWKYRYKLNNEYVDILFSRDLIELDVSNKPPFIFVYKHENNFFSEWNIEELCKEIIVERALKTYPCIYLKIIQKWVDNIDEKIPPVPRITNGKLINEEIVLMEEMEKMIGRRDKYVLSAIQYLLKRRTPHYRYLFPKLAKIYWEKFKSTLPPQLREELGGFTYDKNILDFHEEKLWETIKEFPTEQIPCQDVEIKTPTLKDALNDLADAFDYIEDRVFQRTFQVILI